MSLILPVVNCRDLDEVVARVRAIENTVRPEPNWIHLDVADGKFTYHKTWNDPGLWPKLKISANLEVHLMVEEPEVAAEAWLVAGAKRVVVHYEALFEKEHRPYKSEQDPFQHIRSQASLHQAEVLLAINPETHAEVLLPYGGAVAGFQTLAVHPGLGGQKFLPVILDKISFLRAHFPNATIEVDGGVNPDTLGRSLAAGADVFTSESYIFDHKDPHAAYLHLKSMI